MRSGLPGFAADAGEPALIGVRPRDRRRMTALQREGERFVQQVGRFINFPEKPQDHG